MSIEGIALEHFSELIQTEINSSTKPCLRHAVFHSFLSDYIKQDSATTTAHSNYLIELKKKTKKLMSTLSKIWENADGVQSNLDVPQNYTSYQFYPNVTRLYLIGV